MQLHDLKSTRTKKATRVGRGGKRGTFSGRGSKGQKSRAGTRIRPGFRGGNEPLWKIFPKARGASKKVDIKQRKFKVAGKKSTVVNLGLLNSKYSDGETVSPKTLVEKGIIKDSSLEIKILGDGDYSKKLKFEDVKFSKSANGKIS